MSNYEAFIPITMFTIIGVIVFYWLKSRHELKMAILEKGTNADELKYLLGSYKRFYNKQSPAKWGMVLISVGLAVITGTILQTFANFEEGITFGLVLLFPGLGLLFYYHTIGKKIDEYALDDKEVKE
jgi:hypothetical protein